MTIKFELEEHEIREVLNALTGFSTSGLVHKFQSMLQQPVVVDTDPVDEDTLSNESDEVVDNLPTPSSDENDGQDAESVQDEVEEAQAETEDKEELVEQQGE